MEDVGLLGGGGGRPLPFPLPSVLHAVVPVLCLNVFLCMLYLMFVNSMCVCLIVYFNVYYGL